MIQCEYIYIDLLFCVNSITRRKRFYFNSSQYFIASYFIFLQDKVRKMRDLHSSRNIHSVTKLRITWNILLESIILCNTVYTCITISKTSSKRISSPSERFLSQRHRCRFRETVDPSIDRRSLNCPSQVSIRCFLTVSCLYAFMIGADVAQGSKGIRAASSMMARGLDGKNLLMEVDTHRSDIVNKKFE